MTRLSGNAFLDNLASPLREDCFEHATRRVWQTGAVLGHKGERYSSIHFPISGMISEVEEGSDGGTAEVTIVGFEGCSGIEALLGSETQPFLRCVAIETEALEVSVTYMRELCAQSTDVRRILHGYVAARLRGLGISIGCYARHPVPARLARWLLRVGDRTFSSDFVLTHETMSLMLGVRRATVTRAMAELVAGRALSLGRNRVHITDRKRLEALACSCYPDARDVFDHLYGRSLKQTEIS